MSQYVILVNWTEKGVGGAKETTERARQVQDMIKQQGGNMHTLLWTLGRYDMVGMMEAPDDETAALIGLKVGAMGRVRTETLRAFTADEMSGIAGKL